MSSFLAEPPSSDGAERIYADDVAEHGFVMNLSRVWAYQPATLAALSAAMTQASAGLDLRQRGILVLATASARLDSYCALAWGERLANVAGEPIAASLLRREDEGLTPAEQAMASWARQVVRDPGATEPADVEVLRDAGYTDAEVFAITTYVALRLAFATVNNALGAQPDAGLAANAPPMVAAAVTYGRPVAPA